MLIPLRVTFTLGPITTSVIFSKVERIQTANYIWRLSLTQAILPGHEAIRPGEIFSSSAG